MSSGFNDELDYAENSIRKAIAAVDNQSELVIRLRRLEIDVSDAVKVLNRLQSELRQWREYKALLLIRIEITQDQPVD